MHDLDEHGQEMEKAFGLISQGMIFALHNASVAFGSKWDLEKPETMEIIVTKETADWIFETAKEIESGYDIGISPEEKKKISAAKEEAHKYLYEEANDPNTSIERKIELVKMTSKNQ